MQINSQRNEKLRQAQAKGRKTMDARARDPNYIEKRFWNKVDGLGPDECWNWYGSLWHGYGTFRVMGHVILAHRFAWSLQYGEIPNGMCICHTCDNRRCTNFRHLFLGTKRDNTIDCINKGRFPFTKKGEEHKMSKLTSQQVISIRKKHASGGITCYALGREYGVTGEEIMAIVKRKIWKHI